MISAITRTVTNSWAVHRGERDGQADPRKHRGEILAAVNPAQTMSPISTLLPRKLPPK